MEQRRPPQGKAQAKRMPTRPSMSEGMFAENDRFKVIDAGVAPDKHRDASDHIAYFRKLIFKR